ncbi:polymeric immunoglobulin receptor-like isoform X3 [Channa argus]|uniref:polymeric immunoglobulin receptor-like isoform X3 n=1 Tax=Channa argus TaxID=215402 RepID=UPI00352154C0
MMKSFFLLLLSVMAGCDNEHEVKGCRGGWVEFICVYPEGQRTYQQIYVVHDKQTTKSTVKDKWENEGRIFLYHNTTAKYLKVLIKQLQPEDFKEEYECKFNPESESSKKVELEYEFNNCQTPLPVIVTRTDKVTFTCDMSEYLRQNDRVKFFCKENGFICEDILPTNSSPKSNRRFTVTDTDRGFSVSISDVSSEDAGVYWCGVKSRQGKYRSAFRQIQLQVLSDSQVGVTAAVVCAAVLAVVILLVLFFIRSKTRRNKAEKQKNKEQKDHSYAEIQEPPQKRDPGAAMKTVYVPSAFMDYSEITFKNISEEVNGDIYSTVRDNDQHSTYATVHDSKPSL